jgi:hypothetical protein
MRSEQMNILVSVSGGRSSAMMARHIQTDPRYKDANKLFVFANTGMERPETITFLQDMERHWGIDLVKIEGVYSQEIGIGTSYKIVEYDELDMSAQVFSNCIADASKGNFTSLPFQGAPYCSSRMKKEPIEKLANVVFGKNNYTTAMGFRLEDMPKRISWAEIKHDEKRIYPLITDFPEPVGLRALGQWWQKQPFKLGISSRLGNCELCWKKSDKNLVETIQHGTRFVDWWREKESQYNQVAFRGNKSIDDFVKMAAMPQTLEMNFEDIGEECSCGI